MNEAKETGGMTAFLRKLFGGGEEATLKESLEEVFEEHDEAIADGSMSSDERTMLQNLLTLGSIRVDDVMVPRVDIVAVSLETPYDDLIRVFASEGHSRLPVFKESMDEILGMVHVKDALMALSEKGSDDVSSTQLITFQRAVLFVPGSMKVVDLLSKMRANRTHMAIVVDEYGGTDGLVTIEDLVEEIVGEIEDEHDDEEEDMLVPLGLGNYDADARLEMDEIAEHLGVDLLEGEEEEVDTLGGLVFAIVGKVPEIGEVIEHISGYSFEVLDADPRRIKKIRIHGPEVRTDRDY